MGDWWWLLIVGGVWYEGALVFDRNEDMLGKDAVFNKVIESSLVSSVLLPEGGGGEVGGVNSSSLGG